MFTLGKLASLAGQIKPMALAQNPDVIAGGYTQIPDRFYHANASRNALGLVGGNDVSVASGNLVDVESELRNITRDLSRAPTKNYVPSCQDTDQDNLTIKHTCAPSSFSYLERSSGNAIRVDMSPMHLKTSQFASYPGVPAPEPLKLEVYNAFRF
jgi:hypothetical protein